MSTTSEVKAGLDDIAKTIRAERQALTLSAARISSAVSNLNQVPQTFGALITTIGAFTPTGALETLAKDELAKLTTEFNALKAKATAAKTALDAINFAT